MLQSVQRLMRAGGFRPRLFENRRELLRYQAIAKIQSAEEETSPGRPTTLDTADGRERFERLLRHAAHRPEELPE